MREIYDIHNREADLNNLLEKFKKIRDVNKPMLSKYYEFISADGLSVARKDKELRILMKLSKWLKKDFRKAKKDDIIKLVEILEEQDFAEWTKCDYKVIIKKFYSWLRGLERKEYPPEVRWIKTTLKNKNNKLPEELLTKEEIDKIVSHAEHPRDKAFIRTLAESGCRIGEVANLRIKDVTFDDLGSSIIVTGKTGDRRIRLIESTSLLGEWLDIHPFKDNPDSFLWLGFGTKNKNKTMSYTAYAKIIRSAMDKTGIKKKIYPHLFRHSRATELAKHLTEFQLKQYMGWTMGSDMPQNYVHLSGKDLDNAILKANGMDVPEEEKPKPKFKECPRCHLKNDVSKDYCGRCGSPLDIKKIIEIEEENKKQTEIERARNFDSVVQMWKLFKPKDKQAEKEINKIYKNQGITFYSKKDTRIVNRILDEYKELVIPKNRDMTPEEIKSLEEFMKEAKKKIAREHPESIIVDQKIK